MTHQFGNFPCGHAACVAIANGYVCLVQQEQAGQLGVAVQGCPVKRGHAEVVDRVDAASILEQCDGSGKTCIAGGFVKSCLAFAARELQFLLEC